MFKSMISEKIFLPLLLFFFSLLALPGNGEAAAQDPFSPVKTYQKYCAVCHGKSGDARGGTSQGMVPPPRDFTDPGMIATLTRDRMINSIKNGRKNTAMVAWGTRFSDQEIGQLAEYISDSLMLSSRTEEASPGRRLFADNCSVCHGDKGNTAVWAKNGLTPPPRDFTSEQAKRELTPERMIFSITYGRPNTAMPAWNERLSKTEIQAVSDYIRKGFIWPEGEKKVMPAAGGGGHQHAHFDPVEMARPLPLNMVGDIAWGRAFYENNCSDCHGKVGDGKGPRADFIFPKPRDFTHPAATNKFNREHLFEVITHGIPRTEMSAWGKVLNRQEIANVTEYLFTAFIAPRLPEGFLTQAHQKLISRKPMVMHHSHAHPGVPMVWMWPVILLMGMVTLWILFSKVPQQRTLWSFNLVDIPGLKKLVGYLTTSPQPLAMLKLLSAAVFLLIIGTGFLGTQWPERNFATVFVWGFWWPLVIISVFFLGSAWCAICPWETLAKLLVFRKLWRRPAASSRQLRKVPQRLRNVWVALFLFIGLTWLELGAGVTSIPKATAGMALLMLILAVLALFFYERKAFCRYFCPVGRTIGYYSRLAPIEVRPLDTDVCADCKTMECYNGTEELEPCPTHLTLGRFSQNTFCLSCGACVLSCPHKNASWKLRPMASEATDQARPQWDGSWFMLGLLGLTLFHGITMVWFWQDWVKAMADTIQETGQPLVSFTILLWFFFFVPAAVYGVAIKITQWVSGTEVSFKMLFSRMAFLTLPLAFAYHLAHNLEHLIKETAGLTMIFKNPLGMGTVPLTAMERTMLMEDVIIPNWGIYLGQMGLMAWGFWLAIQIIRHRGRNALESRVDLRGIHLLPLVLFAAGVTGFNLWLMAQDMLMRM